MNLRPEQWFLFAALVLAGALGAAKALTMPQLEDAPPDRMVNAQKLDPAPYDETARRLAEPPAVPESPQHGIYVSRMIAFFPADKSFKVVDGSVKTDDGLTIGWKLQHNFPIDDPGVAGSDPDKDGFSNLEEFNARTEPRDPKSRPSLLLKLRIEKYTAVPFRIEFKGYAPDATDGRMQFQLNFRDAARRSRFVKEGDELEGFKIGAFRQKIVEELNKSTNTVEKKDRSELELLDQQLGETLTLVLNMETPSNKDFVKLRVDSPQGKVEPDTIRRGEKFTLDGKTYQLIRPSATELTLKDMQSGEVLERVAADKKP